MFRYYSAERPVAPGSFPKPNDNKVKEIENFTDKKYCPEIERDAWGYIEYEKPLSAEDAEQYELIGAEE